MKHKQNDLFAQLDSTDSDNPPLIAAEGIIRKTTRLIRDMGFEVLEEFKLNSDAELISQDLTARALCDR